MKTIDTLVQDINEFLVEGSQEPLEELSEKYGTLFQELLKSRSLASSKAKKGTLRMSNVGKPCERQLWYEVNGVEGEPLPPEAHMKFLFGDVIELLLLFLAEASGHVVEGTQDTQEIEGIKGHRDAVIDGTLIDVKSASSYSFQKFENGSLAENDSFGYIDQIQSYLYAGQTDDKITDKDRAAFLVVDKTLGKICLDIHERKNLPYDKIFRHKKAVVSSPEIPERGFSPIPDGKSGNEKLGTNCSYCQFKATCFPQLRAFAYSAGPRYLSRVVKEPDVYEIPVAR